MMATDENGGGGDRRDEVHVKVARVRALLEREGLDGVLISKQPFVCWIAAGLKSAVVRGTDPGFVRALITANEALIVSQNIEGSRIAVEDPPENLGFELVQLPWQGPAPEAFAVEICPADRLGNDGLGPGRSIEDGLLEARLPLLPLERERMRALGADATEVLETTMRTTKCGATERQVAAGLAAGLELRGIFPSVLMVGADARRRRYRHPTVSDATAQRDVLGVLCVERDGLYVAVSRSISFGAPDPVLAERHRIACAIEAELMLSTHPGKSYQEVLEIGVDAYARHGYRGEWELHYQGGPIGYGPREALVAPASVTSARVSIANGQACAWNPTVQGAKSEDTFLVCESGPEIVTDTGGWPTMTFDMEAGTLTRPAILGLPE